MPASALFGHRFSHRQPVLDVDQRGRALAVLSAAKSVIQRGWLQDCWYVLEAPDGRRRFVGTATLKRRRDGAVVQACLVGAVVEAARWHSPEPGTAGCAIDALWCALLQSEGRRLRPDRRLPSPSARRMYVRELTRWNDRRDRTQDDVLRLVDLAIGRLGADTSLPAGHRPDPRTAPATVARESSGTSSLTIP